MERGENALTENTETDFYLDLLVLSWRSSSSEEICLPRPPVGFCCRKLSRDTLAVEWDPRSESSRLLPALCARDQEHSPHNSRRPPQATAQATCGPVTPYQHVMGERRPQPQAGLSETRRARRRTDTALFRGRFCTGALARNFPRGASGAPRRYSTPGKVAPLLQ